MLEYTVLIISALSILLFLYGIIVTLNVMVTGEILNPIGTTIITIILRVAVHLNSILHLKLQQLATPSIQD
ncbi:hypothetical protein [Solibacillus sp. NPDC093137]|uniref:hypothetical protein n=1 Tax=Solibacillus sp. NPDC093137 TaxID=3390678 RepID=UPI003D06597C